MTNRIKKAVSVLILSGKSVEPVLKTLNSHFHSLIERAETVADPSDYVRYKQAADFVCDLDFDIDFWSRDNSESWTTLGKRIPDEAVLAVNHCYSVAVAAQHVDLTV